MTDLAVKVILTAEGAQLTSGSRVAEKDIDRVTDAARKAGVATSELATRTNTASSAMQAETRSAGQASKAINDQVESLKKLAQAQTQIGSGGGGRVRPSRGAEVLEANNLAKATANLGDASRGAAGGQAALGGVVADTAGRLGGLRGAAAGAAGQIEAAAGVSEGALASVGLERASRNGRSGAYSVGRYSCRSWGSSSLSRKNCRDL